MRGTMSRKAHPGEGDQKRGRERPAAARAWNDFKGIIHGASHSTRVLSDQCILNGPPWGSEAMSGRVESWMTSCSSSTFGWK